MSFLTKQYVKHWIKITLTSLLVFGCCLVFTKNRDIQPEIQQLSIKAAKQLKFQYQDSAYYILQLLQEKGVKTEDTLLTINALVELASLDGHQANYKQSYDQLWAALLLADAAQLDIVKANIYKAIGRYYSFYNRKEKALEFLQLALDLKKQLVREGKMKLPRLTDNYHAFTATLRELKEPMLGEKYLDSCFLYYESSESYIQYEFLKFEQAVLLNAQEKYEESLEIFKNILPWFSKNRPNYQVLVYHYLGNSYLHLEKYSESESCYKKALDISNQLNCHKDFTPLVFEGLAKLYHLTGDHLKAYKSLETAKELDALFFDSRSKNNRPLLEIQDDFRKEKEIQANLAQEAQLLKLEQDKKVSFLERIILIGFIGFLVLFGILYFNYIRTKHRSEKLFIQKRKALEIQKANEIVELKNKELATSALKLIEKETFIGTLKDRLSKEKGPIPQRELEQIIRSVSNNQDENWKEFQARFISVNKRFYENLKQQFPKLTQGDQKLCALIKLNFSSKEISKLLGISIESVHTTRSRLRKKLGLSRAVNLKEFIANI